jgi:mannose-6-phosphate isomerase-like protein (cupin superfamily)
VAISSDAKFKITRRIDMTRREILLVITVAILAFAGGRKTLAQTGAEAEKTAATFDTPASAMPVVYFSKDDVVKHFNLGDTLYQDANDSRDYRIATSRREKPGTAEVHMKWTDVCYIVKGEATVVTGGKVMDVKPENFYPNGKPFPKDEIRGGDIVGGEAHHLVAGDVIIIPNGVPHSFTEVSGSFWYYNVKVR